MTTVASSWFSFALLRKNETPANIPEMLLKW